MSSSTSAPATSNFDASTTTSAVSDDISTTMSTATAPAVGDDAFDGMKLEHEKEPGSSKAASSGDTSLIFMTVAISFLLLLAVAVVVVVVVQKRRKPAEDRTPIVHFTSTGYITPSCESNVYDSAV